MGAQCLNKAFPKIDNKSYMQVYKINLNPLGFQNQVYIFDPKTLLPSITLHLFEKNLFLIVRNGKLWLQITI